MCVEGRAGKREAKGKSREEEMHEWVRRGRCRIWKGVALRSGWGGTEHDEGRGGAMRAVSGQENVLSVVQWALSSSGAWAVVCGWPVAFHGW